MAARRGAGARAGARAGTGAALLLALLPLDRPPQPLRAEVVPPLRPGEEYAQARGRLLARGWRATVRREAEPCSVLPGDRRCTRFPELASCAPTGLGLCRFEWLSPEGRAYAVITREGRPDGTPGRIERWFPLR